MFLTLLLAAGGLILIGSAMDKREKADRETYGLGRVPQSHSAAHTIGAYLIAFVGIAVIVGIATRLIP